MLDPELSDKSAWAIGLAEIQLTQKALPLDNNWVKTAGTEWIEMQREYSEIKKKNSPTSR